MHFQLTVILKTISVDAYFGGPSIWGCLSSYGLHCLPHFMQDSRTFLPTLTAPRPSNSPHSAQHRDDHALQPRDYVFGGGNRHHRHTDLNQPLDGVGPPPLDKNSSKNSHS
ncbi:Zinc finger protein 364 [Caligus rogercresseyi]|uniref:Zinc finger protein 364 n=1 Tax=Caligus rogercresseyi TaxID=217165 RepID=A0A7T8KCV9_CALRO|nr:Zinc finger protein 364 [Caligus rogercresseyi]